MTHDVEGMTSGYRIRFVLDNGWREVKAFGDRGSGLPADGAPVEFDERGFRAVIGPVDVDASRTLLGLGVARCFELAGELPEGRSILDYDGALTGSVEEWWEDAGRGCAQRAESANNERHPALETTISGRFVMLRGDGGDRPSVSFAAGRGEGASASASEAAVACSAANIATAIMGVSPAVPPGGSERTEWPFLPRIPYHDFVQDTIERAEDALDDPFRYKKLLYTEWTGGDESDAATYVLHRIGEMEDFWKDDDRKRACEAARDVIGALRYAPENRDLRHALLDIYYDFAVAEAVLARRAHAEAARISFMPAAEGAGADGRRDALIDRRSPN